MPQVSVIIPTYNCAQYICQAVDSVLAQTFKDYEIVVVDDGSTDDTRQQLEPYFGQIKYVYQENQERSAARNTGISHAKGRYLAFLDADDFWLPTYLEKQVANLDAHPELGLSRTWVYDTDPSGQPIRVGGNGAPNAKSHEEFLAALLIDNCMSSIAVVVRTECLRAVGGFDPELKQGEDWDLWLRIALRYPIGTVPEPLACYRHSNVFMPARMHRRGVEQAYVRIMEKAFDQLKDSPLYNLRSQALGRAYWRSAWVNYALGNIETGQSLMTQSYKVYPDFFSPPYHKFVKEVAYRADALYELETPLDEALTCIDRLFTNLPTWAQPLQRLKRLTKGQYCGLHLFRSRERRDWPAVLRAAPCAAAFNPRWLINLGFVSITARALVSLIRRQMFQYVSVKGFGSGKD